MRKSTPYRSGIVIANKLARLSVLFGWLSWLVFFSMIAMVFSPPPIVMEFGFSALAYFYIAHILAFELSFIGLSIIFALLSLAYGTYKSRGWIKSLDDDIGPDNRHDAREGLKLAVLNIICLIAALYFMGSR